MFWKRFNLDAALFCVVLDRVRLVLSRVALVLSRHSDVLSGAPRPCSLGSLCVLVMYVPPAQKPSLSVFTFAKLMGKPVIPWGRSIDAEV